MSVRASAVPGWNRPKPSQKAFDAKHNHYVNVSNQYKENGTRTVPQEGRCDFSDTIRGE